MSNFVVFTDGGSRGNPGPSAGGWVIYSGESVVSKGSEYFGIGTNNQAEYKAVISALRSINDNLKADKISFYLDSELVVKQLNGVYKIKDATLKNLSVDLKRLKDNMAAIVTFEAIRREKNKIADRLVNEKLDEARSI